MDFLAIGAPPAGSPLHSLGLLLFSRLGGKKPTKTNESEVRFLEIKENDQSGTSSTLVDDDSDGSGDTSQPDAGTHFYSSW